MTSNARAQRLIDEFEDGSFQLGGFSIRHGIAWSLYELVGQVVPEEHAPYSVDPPESMNTIAIFAAHAERTRLRGELVEIIAELTAPPCWNAPWPATPSPPSWRPNDCQGSEKIDRAKSNNTKTLFGYC
jgi:hypothetical protein